MGGKAVGTMKDRIEYLEHLTEVYCKKVEALELARVAFERQCGPGGFEDVLMRLRKVSPNGAYWKGTK